MINVLADRYLHNIESYLPKNINLTLFDPNDGFPADLSKAHGLLIRTVLPVNRQSLPKIPENLEFVGTASAGSDHVNTEYLRANGVAFTNAAGCNARSVAEYIATALLLWSEARKEKLTKLEIGIVGAGHVGQEVIHLLNQLNVPFKIYDPPREQRENDFSSVSLGDILRCDVLTFHTPLTNTGNWSTYHWLNKEKLNQHAFHLIINTSRGGVIAEKALLEAKRKGTIRDIIVDVWEDEPNFKLDTANEAFIKTPHIAGYSEQAKNNATKIVVDAMIDHFDIENVGRELEQHQRTVQQNISNFDTFSELLTELHPIRKYEHELENIINENPEKRGSFFNKLRAEYPLRQEFANTYLPASYFQEYPLLKKLGFSQARVDTK